MLSRTFHGARLSLSAALITAFVLAAVAVLAAAAPARAHDELLGSDPAAGSTLDGLPAELRLTFSGVIASETGASEVQVTDASGTALTDGEPTAQDNVLTQPLAGEASGAVTVLWKVVSSDGHPISGELSFTVADAPAPTPTGGPAPTETDATTPSPTPTATPTELTDDMSVDWGATILANLLPVLLGAAVLAAIVGIVLAVRRREPPSPTSGPGSEPPADH